jgi:hypothetical protein
MLAFFVPLCLQSCDLLAEAKELAKEVAGLGSALEGGGDTGEAETPFQVPSQRR